MGYQPCGNVGLCKGSDSIGMYLTHAIPGSSTLLCEVSWPPWIARQHCSYVPCKYDCK